MPPVRNKLQLTSYIQDHSGGAGLVQARDAEPTL